MQVKNPSSNLARRQFGRIALGGAAALALAACGGGSGSDSDNQTNLLDVYNKLTDGMGPAEVTKLVGRTANDIGGTSYIWHNGSESLSTNFNHGSGTQLSGANWYIGSSQSRSKLFKEI